MYLTKKFAFLCNIQYFMITLYRGIFRFLEVLYNFQNMYCSNNTTCTQIQQNYSLVFDNASHVTLAQQISLVCLYVREKENLSNVSGIFLKNLKVIFRFRTRLIVFLKFGKFIKKYQTFKALGQIAPQVTVTYYLVIHLIMVTMKDFADKYGKLNSCKQNLVLSIKKMWLIKEPTPSYRAWEIILIKHKFFAFLYNLLFIAYQLY